jgi:hypothetical protein
MALIILTESSRRSSSSLPYSSWCAPGSNKILLCTCMPSLPLPEELRGHWYGHLKDKLIAATERGALSDFWCPFYR